MSGLPKAVKRLVRAWAAVAHERELGQALLGLRTHFDERQAAKSLLWISAT
jgi:hypothetical protein